MNPPRTDCAAQSAPTPFDVAIIGAGPAGCSAALWLSETGLRVALIEQSDVLLPSLAHLDLPQKWVLGEISTSTAELARRYARHIGQQPGVRLFLSDTVAGAHHAAAPQRWTLTTQAGQRITCRAILVCTGVRARQLPQVPAHAAQQPWDAATLTNQRAHLRPGRFLLLGGGDNAVENAAYLAHRGHHVTLWSRGPLRAGQHLLQALRTAPVAQLRIQQPMPCTVEPEADAHSVRAPSDAPARSWRVTSAAHGAETFDYVAALLGNAPNDEVCTLLAQACDTPGERLHERGVFVAGDLAARWHPCISTAMADGAHTARQLQSWLEQPTPEPAEPAEPAAEAGAVIEAAPVTPPPAAPSSATHILTLTGLRFNASLGILAHELSAPQPIQVDAQLHLGTQPLRPRDDDIGHVLDYRKVRHIIIEECTREHVNLLESLIGKLAQRLLQLPGVQGVRVKIAKLEIFDDCEVAIRAEAGHW